MLYLFFLSISIKVASPFTNLLVNKIRCLSIKKVPALSKTHKHLCFYFILFYLFIFMSPHTFTHLYLLSHHIVLNKTNQISRKVYDVSPSNYSERSSNSLLCSPIWHSTTMISPFEAKPKPNQT